MNASFEILAWIVSGIASLSIVAILWAWANGRLPGYAPSLRRDGPTWPPPRGGTSS